MIAYCFRDGIVQVTEDGEAPEGSLELFSGPHRKVLRVIADTTENRQVPGLEKSSGLTEDFRILTDYLERLREQDNPLIKVSDLTMDQVESEGGTHGP